VVDSFRFVVCAHVDCRQVFFLCRRCDRGGNRYWIVDEIEAAGCVSKLVHARKAKLMMGMINKTNSSTRGG
jgi:hypothetical protein